MKQRIPLWIRCCPVPNLLRSDVFIEKSGFLLTQYCGHNRTKSVFCWIAGGVNWTVVAITDLRWRLPIRWWQLLCRDVIHQSAGVNYCSAIFFFKWSKQTQNIFCTFILSMTQLFTTFYPLRFECNWSFSYPLWRILVVEKLRKHFFGVSSLNIMIWIWYAMKLCTLNSS